VLRAYQRRTVAADALMASTYLAGTNTRAGVRRMVVDFRINAMSRRRR
jgi:putative transposase